MQSAALDSCLRRPVYLHIDNCYVISTLQTCLLAGSESTNELYIGGAPWKPEVHEGKPPSLIFSFCFHSILKTYSIFVMLFVSGPKCGVLFVSFRYCKKAADENFYENVFVY